MWRRFVTCKVCKNVICSSYYWICITHGFSTPTCGSVLRTNISPPPRPRRHTPTSQPLALLAGVLSGHHSHIPVKKTPSVRRSHGGRDPRQGVKPSPQWLQNASNQSVCYTYTPSSILWFLLMIYSVFLLLSVLFYLFYFRVSAFESCRN